MWGRMPLPGRLPKAVNTGLGVVGAVSRKRICRFLYTASLRRQPVRAFDWATTQLLLYSGNACCNKVRTQQAQDPVQICHCALIIILAPGEIRQQMILPGCQPALPNCRPSPCWWRAASSLLQHHLQQRRQLRLLLLLKLPGPGCSNCGRHTNKQLSPRLLRLHQ